MKYLKVIELIHCSNRSFMGSQFIFSNSVKPIWALLSKFRQKRMHLFWSICNLDFNLLFRLEYQAEHACDQNEVLSERCKAIYEEVSIKIYFFCTKNLSLQPILLITFKAMVSPERFLSITQPR